MYICMYKDICMCMYVYMHPWIYEVHTISFQTFFVWVFQIVCRFLKIHYAIAIHLMRWLTNFYDFSFKWTATAAIEIHPTKAWLSQLVNFKNAIWHFRRTLCFKLGKKCHRKHMACFRLFLEHLAWIEHQFLSTGYLTKMGIKIVPQPPYCPDLAPCDFWLFSKLRGHHHETIEGMKETVTKVIDMVTQEDFYGAFQKLLER